jgi:D-alanine-D-alanine ligase
MDYMKSDLKILICYNEPVKYYSNYLGKEVASDEDNIDLSETEFLKNIEIIKKALQKKFRQVSCFGFNGNIPQVMSKLQNYSPDLIFNFVESVEGNSDYESYAAGLYEILGLEYTGNMPTALSNCLIKSRTKVILESHGITTPDYFIARYKEKFPSEEKFSLRFPVILKLASEDASIGISEFSVTKDYKAMTERVDYLFRKFHQNVIIEEYIEGREINVAILGDKIMPLSEIVFDGLPKNLPKIITYEAKWSPDSVYYKFTTPKCPAKVDSVLRKKIEKLAIDSYKALECRDYARVDIRISKRNVPFVIEVNPNPDISPDSGFVRSAAAYGLSYDKLLYKLAEIALERKSYDKKIAS